MRAHNKKISFSFHFCLLLIGDYLIFVSFVMWFFLCLLFFLLIVVYIFYLDMRKPEGFPPGPTWLPVIGCHLEVRKMIKKMELHHLVWEELCKTFGPIVGLRLGRDRIVIVSGQPLVKQVFVREEFDARPDGLFFRMRSYHKRLGVVFVEGNHFMEQKRFCITALKKLGMGKKIMEEVIVKEAEELVKSVSRHREKNEVLQMNNVFDVAILNSLWALMAGERFDNDDVKLQELVRLVHESFRIQDMSGGLLNQMPFLRFIIPEMIGYNRIRFVLSQFENFLDKIVEEHKKNLGSEAENLIDMFLLEMNRPGVSETFTNEQLNVLLLDLFMAGSETTSNNLSMSMLYMLLYPHVQQKVQEYIDLTVPQDRLPTLQDRPRLSYVEAVLLEIQRHASVVPVAVAHRTTKKVSFQGFTIPKDATVLISLRSVMMDPDHWGDPDNFRPERFLDTNGQIIQDEWFIPFGQGKRRCLGEALARPTMFLLFTAILQNFQLLPTDEVLSTVPQGGITLSPKPFSARVKSRLTKHSRKGN